MIDLMLQQFRKIALVPSLEFEGFAAEIPISHSDFPVAFNLHKDREKAQAGIPANNFLLTAPDDFGIDQRPGLRFGKLQKDDSPQYAELRRRDAAPIARFCAPVCQSVCQVADQIVNFAYTRVFDWGRRFPQNWIAELQDRANSHIAEFRFTAPRPHQTGSAVPVSSRQEETTPQTSCAPVREDVRR